MSHIYCQMEWKDFKFEYNYEAIQLLAEIVSVEANKKAALNLVLPPEWKQQLDKLNRVRAVYGTTALEGNPLSEAEVSHQIDIVEEKNGTKKGTPNKEQQQIRNSAIAQAWVKQRFCPNSAPITVEDILTMHRMVTEGSDEKHNIPGEFRTFPVHVGSPDMGGVHVGAPHARLTELMGQYVEFINSRRLVEGEHPVTRALLAHFFLVTIHPFGDGNGRVSRLVEAAILFQGNYNVHGFYGLSNYFYRNEVAYKTLLQKSRSQQPFNLQEFMAFGFQGFAEELGGINNFIKIKLNRVVYKQMLVRAFNRKVGERRKVLNQREYYLLDFLITQTEPADPFSSSPSKRIPLTELVDSKYIQGAYRRVTPRTFRRELLRLNELGFINFSHDEDLKDHIVELDFSAIGRY
jgi:Fic family protein